MADTLVPLIGSSEAGPLGAVHLPRLWLKGLTGNGWQAARRL